MCLFTEWWCMFWGVSLASISLMKGVKGNRLELLLLPHQPLSWNKSLSPTYSNSSGFTDSTGRADYSNTHQWIGVTPTATHWISSHISTHADTVTSGCCTAETWLRLCNPAYKHKLDKAKHTTAFPSPAGYTQEGLQKCPGGQIPLQPPAQPRGANARTTQQYLKTRESIHPLFDRNGKNNIFV